LDDLCSGGGGVGGGGVRDGRLYGGYK